MLNFQPLILSMVCLSLTSYCFKYFIKGWGIVWVKYFNIRSKNDTVVSLFLCPTSFARTTSIMNLMTYRGTLKQEENGWILLLLLFKASGVLLTFTCRGSREFWCVAARMVMSGWTWFYIAIHCAPKPVCCLLLDFPSLF